MPKHFRDFKAPSLASGPLPPDDIMRFLNAFIRLALDHYVPGRYNGQLFTTHYGFTRITVRIVFSLGLASERVSARIVKDGIQSQLFAAITVPPPDDAAKMADPALN